MPLPCRSSTYLDRHLLPADPARGFNNLPTTRGRSPAPAEQKRTLHLTPKFQAQLAHLHPTSGIGPKSTFLRIPPQGAPQQLQARREGGLLSAAYQAGEATSCEQLARARHLALPQLIRQLLPQEVYRSQRLAPYPNDQAVAQARGLPYDEAWRLGIRPQG